LRCARSEYTNFLTAKLRLLAIVKNPKKLRNCINGRDYKTLYNFWKPSLKGYVDRTT
jgi:hypothetical protein